MPPLAQVAVMGAIVASLLYFPLGVALALALRVAGISFQAFVTFGGAFNVLPGLVIWWLLVFAGACIYTACLIPWGERVIGWPKNGAGSASQHAVSRKASQRCERARVCRWQDAAAAHSYHRGRPRKTGDFAL